MTMKRIRTFDDDHDQGDHGHYDHLDQTRALASCLMFLSQGKELSPTPPISYPQINIDHNLMASFSSGRVFECKTCNRQFPSFQALGGHRASHKRPRFAAGADAEADQQPSPTKPKAHECSICGLEFAIGQALGGHMRRHRATLNSNDHNNQLEQVGSRGSLSPPGVVREINATTRPVVKKSSTGGKKVVLLDLNLTPFENSLEFLKLGKAAPMVDCFF